MCVFVCFLYYFLFAYVVVSFCLSLFSFPCTKFGNLSHELWIYNLFDVRSPQLCSKKHLVVQMVQAAGTPA